MNKETENKLKILFRRVIWDYCHNNLNEEEVKSDVLDYIMDCKGGDNKCFENFIEHHFDEIESQIRLETLKEVLPEKIRQIEIDIQSLSSEQHKLIGKNECRQEIINKAKDIYGITIP